MTEEQPPEDPGAGAAANPPQEAAPPPPVEGAGWVQPPSTQAPAAAPGPAWGQPQTQAPAVGWAQPQPTPGWIQPVATKGPVTILARIAGLFLLLLGLVWGAIGALLVVGGTAFHFLTDRFSVLNTDTAGVTTAGNVVGGVIAGLGIVILVLAIVEVLGGLGALFGKTWGRVLGILYSLVFGAFLLIGLTGSMGAAGGVTGTDNAAGTGVIIILVMFLLYLYSLVILLVRWRGHARA
jgi:hypothetical protein